MIIWSGWGIVIFLIAIVAGFAGFSIADILRDPLHLAYGPEQSLAAALTGVLAASGIFLFAKRIEDQPGRVLIDQATGQHLEVRRSAGSLFFIPTRYWTWIVLALAAWLAVSEFNMTGPLTPTQ